MKRILLLLILCLLTIPAVCAVENKMQLDDETLIRGIVNSEIGRLSRHHAALKMDYIEYKINNGKTTYSQILELEKKYKDDTSANAEINRKYIADIKSFYMFLASYPDEKSMSAEFLKDFNSRKILVPDNEYKLLDKDLKILLAVVNVFN